LGLQRSGRGNDLGSGEPTCHRPRQRYLTAAITVGTASDTKTFPLTVKAQMTDAQAVAAAKAALAIGPSATPPATQPRP
jgi:hypothetical protein